MTKVQTDFDRIARLTQDGWDHNVHYHNVLLKRIPPFCEAALDIGCGAGEFSRLLAMRSSRVLGLDLSPGMIEIARERSRSYPNIEFQVADATRWPFPPAAFDCVASIATLHHLPIEEMLQKMKGTLRAGGVLVILDLCKLAGWRDFLAGAAAAPVGLALRLAKTGRLREPPQVRAAWAEHGRSDVYPTLEEMRQICARVLPAAGVKKHLLWRYSIIWKKTGG